MAFGRTAGVVLATALALTLVGCGSGPTGPTQPGGTTGGGIGGGATGGGGSTGGGTPPPATTATLQVTADSGCAGKESNIQVYVDSSYIGTTQPGDSGLSRTVSIGDHSVSATSARGTQWGPSTVSVGAGGYALKLTCANSTPAPSSATLRVFVDANCSGKAANINISIDGVSSGTTQPGSTGISKVVSVGNHTVFGLASNGTTWPTFTVAVPSSGSSQDLTCR